jgi:S-adenosylmethionine hydrolase
MVPIVTLTTDLGLYDYYVGLIKGAILSQASDLCLVDITHNIPHHDIVQAAYILKNCFHSFPNGTIHIVSVNNFYSKTGALLLAKQQGHFFIVPDNGVLSLLFEELPFQIYRLPFFADAAFTIKNMYATVIRHIKENGRLDEIGQEVKTIEQRITLKPVISSMQIRGSVIHIDHFENVVVNITQSLFEQVGQHRPFALYFKRYEPIEQLSTHYQDVPIGEVLCLFNSANYLEIAINMGKAASMLGLSLNDTIQIDFRNA